MSRTHHKHPRQFYVDYYLNGYWPDCKCGCGEKVGWDASKKTFRSFCAGHQSRVHNNWGHNTKAIERSAETRRQQYASGERKVWNEGLTKDINESVKLNGELRSKAYTEDVKKEYSKRMKENRLNGTIPTLRGSQHSQWNGGTSSVSMLVYNDVRFYEQWKRPILIRDGFKCTDCGSSNHLHVHHDKERLSEIIKNHVGNGIDPENYEEKRKAADAVVDFHIKYKVSGITLCEKCHSKLHPSLNF